MEEGVAVLAGSEDQHDYSLILKYILKRCSISPSRWARLLAKQKKINKVGDIVDKVTDLEIASLSRTAKSESLHVKAKHWAP